MQTFDSYDEVRFLRDILNEKLATIQFLESEKIALEVEVKKLKKTLDSYLS